MVTRNEATNEGWLEIKCVETKLLWGDTDTAAAKRESWVNHHEGHPPSIADPRDAICGVGNPCSRGYPDRTVDHASRLR